MSQSVASHVAWLVYPLYEEGVLISVLLCGHDGELPAALITEWVAVSLELLVVVIDLPEELDTEKHEAPEVMLSIWIVVFGEALEISNSDEDIVDDRA